MSMLIMDFGEYYQWVKHDVEVGFTLDREFEVTFSEKLTFEQKLKGWQKASQAKKQGKRNPREREQQTQFPYREQEFRGVEKKSEGQ